jgi:hypothetical protein
MFRHFCSIFREVFDREKHKIVWLCHRRANVGLRIYKTLTPVFRSFLQNRENRQLVLSCMSVRLSFRMEQLGSYRKDFNEIWYFDIIFRISAEITQVSSKPDYNNRHCTWRRVYIWTVSRWMLLRMKNISDKSCKLFRICFPPKILPFMRCGKMWCSQTRKYGACTLHDG